VPPATPFTTPSAEPTVATVTLLLVQAPPVTVFDKDVVDPAHTVNVPEIVDGALLIVTTVVRIQPVGSI
jgi:hypothetical protein